MNGIMKINGYSYRITNEPETNENGNIYVFNGIRLDASGNKDALRLLFVKNSLRFVDFSSYGQAEKIGTLPAEYTDDRFHKKYRIDSSENSSFDFYVVKKPSYEPEKSTDSKQAAKYAVGAASIIIVLVLLAAAIKVIGGPVKNGGPADTDSTDTSISDVSDDAEFGDINGDGRVNSIDSSHILANYNKISTGEEISEKEKSRGDVNRDGKCDASDASLILKYYSYVSTSNSDMTFSDFCSSYFSDY